MVAFLAYLLGRGHEYAAWLDACETPPDPEDLPIHDTYQAALLRTHGRN